MKKKIAIIASCFAVALAVCGIAVIKDNKVKLDKPVVLLEVPADDDEEMIIQSAVDIEEASVEAVELQNTDADSATESSIKVTEVSDMSDAKAEEVPSVAPVTEPVTEVVTKTATDLSTDSKAEIKADSKAETNTDSKAESNTDLKVDSKDESGTVAKPDTESTTKSDESEVALPEVYF